MSSPKSAVIHMSMPTKLEFIDLAARVAIEVTDTGNWKAFPIIFNAD